MTLMWRRLLWSLAFLFAAKGTTATQADIIAVLSSGDNVQDTTLLNALLSGGHTVSLTSQYTEFDGSTSLADFDTIVLQTNFNWANGDMPVAGQSSLLNFIRNGGGLITTEWLIWKVGATGGAAFSTLSDAFPIIATNAYRSTSEVTYNRVTPNAVLNAGLPNQFTFAAHDIGGTETQFQPKTGATVFYGSDFFEGEGVVGWDFGSGRVLSLSTPAGFESLADPNFSRLISNAATWAGRSGSAAVPEPSMPTALSIAAALLLLRGRRRLRPNTCPIG